MSPGVLAHYDPNRPTIISADASSTGIGAVLIQIQENGERRPICYASRSLSETEKRYAVIEKEALAVTWASEKFSDYVLEIPFVLETDHKPLTALLNSIELSKMPPRPSRDFLRSNVDRPQQNKNNTHNFQEAATHLHTRPVLQPAVNMLADKSSKCHSQTVVSAKGRNHIAAHTHAVPSSIAKLPQQCDKGHQFGKLFLASPSLKSIDPTDRRCTATVSSTYVWNDQFSNDTVLVLCHSGAIAARLFLLQRYLF